METLELQDIQGIIVRGYSNLDAACFVLLGIRDAVATRRWLSTLSDQIQNGQDRPSETCLNIAFTFEGLKALGLDQQTLDTFPTEFREGMTAPYKSRFLGDRGDNAPELWDWGGTNSASVHILLMLYAMDEARLTTIYEALAGAFASGSVEQIHKLETFTLKDEHGGSREHFGFRDAIGQPIIEGLSRVGSPDNTIKAGEFILGYPNEYGLFTETPTVSAQQDRQNLLQNGRNGSGGHDLGRNGSYLVFRQLSQKVQEFWRSLDDVTQKTDGASAPEARLKLAAKMVGRWPDGTPLVEAPDQDNSDMEDQNEFAYHRSDPYGFKCPLGAHIRRSNPRDSLDPQPGTQKSIAVNKTHRLLRRGRSYGKPIAASLDPQEMLNTEASGERGLHFVCISANISRQFEFVQQAWMNNPKFNGLYSDTDPLIGDRGRNEEVSSGRFTVQATPVRQCVKDLPRFVQVRGGAYFFMPGIKAIRFLASS
ncbi:MAG: Dyp-type peroxidase [Chroococcidiopsidaceae cyanobacterium CP_BM_RX_35]|nr:Dyp-type peroxidase [Chroococcidiopsidaceae cyanobacterium CP_BM_RX_35]